MIQKTINSNDKELNHILDLVSEFSRKEAELASLALKIGKSLQQSKKRNILTAVAKSLSVPQNYVNYFKDYAKFGNIPPNFLELLESFLLDPRKVEERDPVSSLFKAVYNYFEGGTKIYHFNRNQLKTLNKLLSYLMRYAADVTDLKYLDPLRWTYCLSCDARPGENGLNICHSKKLKLPERMRSNRYFFNETTTYYPIPLCDKCYDEVSKAIIPKKGTQNHYEKSNSTWLFGNFPYRKLVDIYMLALERYYELIRLTSNENCISEPKPSIILQIEDNL